MLLKVEIEKLLKRKDIWLLLTMNFIPLMYGIGMASHSGNITYEGIGKASGLSFLGDMTVFVYMLFIYVLVIATGLIRSFKGEIENGSIKLYLQRTNSRSKLFWAKLLSYSIVIISSFVIFALVCIVSYYSFLISRTDIAMKVFFIDGQILSILLGIFAIISFYIFSGITALLISLYFKVYTSIGLFTIISISLMYLKEFDFIKTVIPIYYLNRIIEDMGMGKDYLASLAFFLLIAVLSGVMLVVGKRRFERSDIG